MPKELKHKQPTSSLAHLLSTETFHSATVMAETERPAPSSGAVVGRIAPKEHTEVPPLAVCGPTREPANIPRQFGLTTTADETLKDLLSIYGEAVGFELSNAELLRGMLHGIRHAMPMLKREARRIGRQKRFKNSAGNEALRDELEQKIGRAFIAGMRAAPEME